MAIKLQNGIQERDRGIYITNWTINSHVTRSLCHFEVRRGFRIAETKEHVAHDVVEANAVVEERVHGGCICGLLLTANDVFIIYLPRQ